MLGNYISTGANQCLCLFM